MKDTKQSVPPNSGDEFRKTLAEISQVFGQVDLALAETFIERVAASQKLRRDEDLCPRLAEMCDLLNDSGNFLFLAPLPPWAVIFAIVPKGYEQGQADELREAIGQLEQTGAAIVFVAEHHLTKWSKSNLRPLLPPANLRKAFRDLQKTSPTLMHKPCWTTQTAILGLRHLDQAVADPMWSVSSYGNTPKNLRSIEHNRGIRALDQASSGSLRIRLFTFLLLLVISYVLVPAFIYVYLPTFTESVSRIESILAHPKALKFIKEHPKVKLLSNHPTLIAELIVYFFAVIITSFALICLFILAFLSSGYVHGLLYLEVATKVLLKKLKAVDEIKVNDSKEAICKLTDISETGFGYLLTQQSKGAGFFTTLIAATLPGVVTAIITGKMGLPSLTLDDKLIPLAISLVYSVGILVAFYFASKTSKAVRSLALHRIRLETLSRALATYPNYYVKASADSSTGDDQIAAM